MILVLASAADSEARAFAEELASVAPAAVLTCRDLAEEPAALCYPDFGCSFVTLDGRKAGIGEIAGVINLLPAVLPDEMFFYAPEEREYQAAESHALLTFFSSELPCPVVNRATPQALNGPCSSSIAWRYFARRSGLSVSPIDLDTDDADNFFGRGPAEGTFEVSCLGECVIDPSGTAADSSVVDLARMAKVEYLRATFEQRGAAPRFVTASAVPDIYNPAARRALAGYFKRTRRCA